MTGVDIKRLIEKCNYFTTQSLYAAAALAVDRTHYEVCVEHFLLKCFEDSKSDMALLAERYGIDRAVALRELTRAMDAFKVGNSARPSFSPVLIELLESAWLVSSVDLQQNTLRSGGVALAYAKRPAYYAQSGYSTDLSKINRQEAGAAFHTFVQDSVENAALQNEDGVTEKVQAAGGSQGFMAQFCEDFTAKARAGKIDTVFGRDSEIRSILTVLARRRKNNPILVGEPGVGKTAVIEGLAKRIVEEDCPESLMGVSLLSLDMGLLEAGASMKGEFERRLKGVIDEVKASPTPIILFIDEAHMLVGAGGQAGGSDAANLLKPALARGELRTCAATTWKEYKKYFEKDPALARRFQLIALNEPDVDSALLILRGIRASYERAHNVLVQDDALFSAVDFSHRFILGRYLPDKAIDVLDTACAKVKMSLSVRPAALEDTERKIAVHERELTALERDMVTGGMRPKEVIERIDVLQSEITTLQSVATELRVRWKSEHVAAVEFIAARAAYMQAMEDVRAPKQDTGDVDYVDGAETVQDTENDGAAENVSSSEEHLEKCRSALEAARAAFVQAQGEEGLLSVSVTPDVVAQVISDWTGVPVGKVAREEASLVAELEAHLLARVKGQDAAITAVSQVIKAGKAGLRAHGAPLGVFLLVGPSGVGKTETGLTLADVLFGNEENAITINMSEFQERHTVSRLIGSPPGYVGYGEGGLLTEAVRRKPYSVVLLDEVEKAHPDVMNLFYQVFDKGELTDAEGKKVSFSSTVVLLTSNLGTDILHAAARQGVSDHASLIAAIHKELATYFKPALLARMTVVPYQELSEEALRRITTMKLDALAERLKLNNDSELIYSDSLIDAIVARCAEVDSGARNIDHILAAHVLPQLAQALLEGMTEKNETSVQVSLGVAEDGSFVIKILE